MKEQTHMSRHLSILEIPVVWTYIGLVSLSDIEMSVRIFMYLSAGVYTIIRAYKALSDKQ